MDSENTSQETDDFRIFSELFAEMQDQVGGRASYPLEEGDKALLNRMADGLCSKEEREKAIEMVVANQEAMSYLASSLKGEDHQPVED